MRDNNEIWMRVERFMARKGGPKGSPGGAPAVPNNIIEISDPNPQVKSNTTCSCSACCGE